MWHKADWDAVKADPTKVQFPREDWIFQHDAEKHAEDTFDESMRRVRQGKTVNGDLNGIDGKKASAVNGHV